MIRIALIAVLAAGLLHGATLAQDKIEAPKKVEGIGTSQKKETDSQAPGKKKPGKPAPVEESVPGEVEILFLNGSKIRVIIETEKLEVASIYGKLTVPIEDVTAIEFGLHYPEGAVEKIDAAIKNLGNGDYRIREGAAKTLIQLGPYAYPAVLRAAKGKDVEVAGRAKDIVEKIQAKHPKKDLKTSTDDRVVTPTQTLVGRILTPTVKTHGEYFGVMEHKLTNMRTLRAVARAGADMDVAVDAAKYANGNQWLDTGYVMDGKSTVLVTAKGLVDQWPQQPGQYMCGPAGNNNGGIIFAPGGGGGMPNPGMKIRVGGNANRMYGGMLIGKIGEDGEPFLIGDRYEIKSDSEGKLFLQIGPSPWNCASTGTYYVKISRKHD